VTPSLLAYLAVVAVLAGMWLRARRLARRWGRHVTELWADVKRAELRADRLQAAYDDCREALADLEARHARSVDEANRAARLLLDHLGRQSRDHAAALRVAMARVAELSQVPRSEPESAVDAAIRQLTEQVGGAA
jgi:F0F1-type ATP synthase membrane subunit b/b'